MKKTLLALLAASAVGAVLAQPASPPGDGMPAGHPKHGPREVNRAEFLNRASKHFDQMDANRDGKLSREEHRAGREARREHAQERREHMKERREQRGERGHRDGEHRPQPAGQEPRPASAPQR